MFNSLRTSFHLSQTTVQRETEHIAHHRPLGLLLVLTLIAWQSGIFSAFAATLPIPTPTKQAYIYIQNNPVVDDSWIGTRVSMVGVTPTVQASQSPIVPTTPTIDTSWLGNFVKKTQTQGVVPVVTQTVPYPAMPIVYTTPNGTLLNNISSSYSSVPPLVTTVFGRNGAVIGQSGDYTTTLVAEGTNLYFTDTRAQNALSGSLVTLSGQIATNTASIGTLSGNLFITNTSLTTAIGNITTLSGVVATISTDLLSLSGTVANKIGLTDLSTLGPLTYNNTTGVFGIDMANSTTTGALSATDWTTFNSKESILTFGTGITRVGNTVGLTTGTDGDILSMASGVPTWITPATVSIPVLSVFGRTGSILATLGDYTTSLVTEGSNLYFTQGRFDSAFSGKTTTNLAEGTNLYFTDTRAQDALSGSLANIGNSINTLSGTLTTLSGTVATKIGLTALSAIGPLAYNNSTGVFSITLANSTTTGALSATDWNTFNNKENVLTFGTGITRVGNTVGLTNTGITFAIGTTGTDMNWSTAFTALGGTATLNIPDASLTARGLVSTGSQVFAGAKTFVTAPIFSGFTLGSVLFASTGGLLAQNNTNFFWDNANTRLGIGIGTPTATLHVQNNLLTTTNLLTLSATGLTTGNALQIIGTGSRSLLRISQDSSDPLDVERVTIGQGGIAVTKPDSLARDQLYVFGRINSSWDHYLADFLGSDVPRTTVDGTTAEGLIWDAGGATPSWSSSNIVGISGARRIGLSATINASAFLGNYTITESSLNPVYEARAIINAANATTRAFIGFTDRAQNATTLATDTNNSTNEIFFRKKAATTTWETVTRSTANATEVVTATAVPVNQWNIFRIEVLGASQTVKFFINGTLVATHTGTTIPAPTIRFGHHIGILVTAATLNTMDIDYIRMWSDDPASTGVSENIPGTSSYVSDLFTPKSNSTLLEAVEITTTKNTLRALNTMISATGTGKIDIDSALDPSDADLSISDAGTYFLQILKAALERLSEIWLDMQLTVRSLVADEVKTKQLCLGETCITEEELKQILQTRSTQSSSSATSSVYVVPVTETNSGTLESGSVDSTHTGMSIPDNIVSEYDVQPTESVIPDTIVTPDTPIVP